MLSEALHHNGRRVRGFALGDAPTGASFSSDAAVSVSLGSSTRVPFGASVKVELPTGGQLWQAPGVTTSDATVLAPSQPPTTSGFVAVGQGTATLTGTPSGIGTGPGTAEVTVAPPPPSPQPQPAPVPVDGANPERDLMLIGGGALAGAAVTAIVCAVTRRR